MNAIERIIRNICIARMWRYRKKTRSALKERRIVIKKYDEACDWAKTAEKNIISIKRENLELHKPFQEVERYLRDKIASEITMVRACKLEKSRESLLSMHSKTNDELMQKINFEVWPEEVENEAVKWRVYDKFCAWGGCSIPTVDAYQTEREALEVAFIRTCLGEKMVSGGICSDCYPEYLDHIL